MNHHAKQGVKLSRRKLLKTATAGLAAAAVLPELEEISWAEPKNQPFIAAYTNQLSYQAGDQVELRVSTSAPAYRIDIARIGAERQVVLTKEGLKGVEQPIPADTSSHGCQWQALHSFPVMKEWRSGYYQILLHSQEKNGGSSSGEAFFVVRAQSPGRDARILLQLATNTYNAYNSWGGTNFYGGPKGLGRRLSFDRPYAGFTPGFTAKYSGWHKWEEPFVQWAERAGYQIEFAVNSDLEFRPEILDRYRLVLSIGHDEYWSAPMRDSLEAFIKKGGNVGFFSGNTCFWQVRSEAEGRALACWKMDFEQDPVYQSDDHRLLTGTWTNYLIKRPENQLTGVSFTYAGYHRFAEIGGDGCYTVHRPDHWIFQGTGLKRDDQLGKKNKIVGYECDGCLFTMENGLPVPTHDDGTPESFEILGSAPAALSGMDNSVKWVAEGLYGKNTKKRLKPGAAMLGIYQNGGTVFTTGCTEWVRGLEGRDPQVEQITRNIFDRLSKPV